MENIENCKRFFSKELDLISDPKVKDFVISVFDKFGTKDFWENPASMSGKNHPKFAAGLNGSVRHTKAAVWWGLNILKMFDLKSFHFSPQKNSLPENPQSKKGQIIKDIVIAALLIHDLKKFDEITPGGKKLDHGLVIAGHGVFLKRAIEKDNKLYDKNNRIHRLIVCGVAGHMGRWTIPTSYRPMNMKRTHKHDESIIANIVHMADFMAAQKVDSELLNWVNDIKSDKKDAVERVQELMTTKMGELPKKARQYA